MMLDARTRNILERAQVLLGERGRASDDKAVTQRELREALAKMTVAAQPATIAPGQQTSAATPAPAPASPALTVVTLPADVTNANGVANTMADVSGLFFPVVGGEIYWFRFVILYTAAATTTGARFSINGPASPTMLAYASRVGLTSSTSVDTFATAYDAPAAAGATSPATAGNVATIEGFIQPSVSGSVVARFASEVAGSAIVAKTGSILQWRRTL